MIEKLYIIGNGFDLHHHLKTSYLDFANYLKVNNRDLYDTLESYVEYPDSENDLWSNFESNLAKLNIEAILSDHEDRLPNYASEEYRDRDKYVFPDIMLEYFHKLTEGLFGKFEDFIQSVILSKSIVESEIELDKDAFFLNFNYTNSLEILYEISPKKILYIHNSAFYSSDQIVLGHGIDPSTFEDKGIEPPDDIDPEDYEKWYRDNDDYDYSYDEGRDNLMAYFKATYKSTTEIISANRSFFQSLKDVKEIIILGHSMSEIDMPYFEKIRNCVDENAVWKVSYYSKSEYDSHKLKLDQLNISENRRILFQISDLLKNFKQLKIDF